MKSPFLQCTYPDLERDKDKKLHLRREDASENILREILGHTLKHKNQYHMLKGSETFYYALKIVNIEFRNGIDKNLFSLLKKQ